MHFWFCTCIQKTLLTYEKTKYYYHRETSNSLSPMVVLPGNQEMHFTKAKGHEQSDQRVSIRALLHIQHRSLTVKTTITPASQSPQLLPRQYLISSLTAIVTIITEWIGIENSHLLNRCKKNLLSFDKAGTKKRTQCHAKNLRNPDSNYIIEKLQPEHAGSMSGTMEH